MTTGLSLFDPLPLHSYDLVVVHPPWPYETWSKRGPALSSPMSSRYAGSGVFCLVHFIGSRAQRWRNRAAHGADRRHD